MQPASLLLLRGAPAEANVCSADARHASEFAQKHSEGALSPGWLRGREKLETLLTALRWQRLGLSPESEA